MFRTASVALISGLLAAAAATAAIAEDAVPAAEPAPAPVSAEPPPPAAAPIAPPVVHRIAPCEGGPHCVSSTSREEGRHVAPIFYPGSDAPAQQAMLRILSGIGAAKVVEVTPGYIRAEFHSTVLRFVDDVEMLFGNHQIQLRSASRVGYYDFGVNRDRVEALRKAFDEIQP